MGEETVFDHAAWLERENRRLNDSLNVVVVQRNEARAALADARDRLDAVDAQRIALEVALESERTALAAANARTDAAEADLASARLVPCPACDGECRCTAMAMAEHRRDWKERCDRIAVQRDAAEEALAAARRECEELRGAVALHLKCPEESAVSCLAEIRADVSVVDPALAAPGDGEEPDPSLDDGSFYEQGGGGHDD